ncbi:MAG: ribosomal protein S18-alanine N-acetyltransferase [Rhodobacteraceae bacterium]|nr:ribosomal protein S18-alanine N-acetyltransferase [Paracoccaceae bacterium]
MTPDDLADLHARSFTVPRPFTAQEFASFLQNSSCFVTERAHGFALGRVIADEAELLTIAVEPSQRRRGFGSGLLQAFHHTARARGAARVFLEVAADNTGAIGLYLGAGYLKCGQRKDYYRYPDGRREDALVMQRSLTAE